MKSEAVSLPVIAGVPLDCSFWHKDGGWSGVCERLSVIVRAAVLKTPRRTWRQPYRSKSSVSCVSIWDQVRGGLLKASRV